MSPTPACRPVSAETSRGSAPATENAATAIERLRGLVRSIPDFPQPGILFRDITPVLADAEAFATATHLMADALQDIGVDGLVGIESRGFIFGTALARLLNRPLLLARKPGKLPGAVNAVSYQLEYGRNTLEMHTDSIRPGGHYALVDDLLATGGTAAATAQLVEKGGGMVDQCCFFIELEALGGSKRLAAWSTHSLLSY